jgi:capsid protein
LTTINQIKLIGIDEERPPLMRKEAYIDLFFKLSQKAPQDWCEDLNKLGHQVEPSFKIDTLKGDIVETWTRDMNLIPQQVEKIKEKIKECNKQYVERLRLKVISDAARTASPTGHDSQQAELNLIIATLDFE